MASKRQRRNRMLVVAVVATALAASLLYHRLTTGTPESATPCQGTIGHQVVRLDPEQARNASTIAAVGKQLGMPDHAVTVALATALQESQLHNLPGGDRDSLGVFQQRPSQGWGTPAEIMRPSHAAASFYRRLVTVSNWSALSLTDAAQAVQRSALPDGYAQWDPSARLLARVLTGEDAAGFACRDTTTHPPTDRIALAAAMTVELGPPGLGVNVDPARGWLTASWLIGHARDFGIRGVTFDGHRWTAGSGAWASDAPVTMSVSIE